MDEFSRMINQNMDVEDLRIYLDNLTHEERMMEIASVKPHQQAKLFRMAAKDLTIDKLIPPDTLPLKEVVFYGRNSLPVFNQFKKPMCRSQNGSSLFGYNDQSMSWITGPGYFVGRNETTKPGEILLDYTALPSETIPDWPALKSNEKGISRLVFSGMKDYLRRVSRNVFIGAAFKKGKSLDAYFILCRR